MTTPEERPGSDVIVAAYVIEADGDRGRAEQVRVVVARQERDSAAQPHLATDHVRVGHGPAVIADGPPLSAVPDLQTSFRLHLCTAISRCQSKTSVNQP